MAETDEGGQPVGRPAAAGGGASGNIFMRKLGPAPLWLWMAGGLGIALGIALWRSNQKKAQAAATTAPPSSAANGTANQTPPFIIQNYPGSTVAGPPGPAGPAGPAGSPAVTPIWSGGAVRPGPVTLPPPTAPPAAPSSPPPPAPSATPTQPRRYTVQPGDNLSRIAQRFGIPGGNATGWKLLWSYNSNTGNRSAAGLPPMRSGNPNLIYAGEVVLVP